VTIVNSTAPDFYLKTIHCCGNLYDRYFWRDKKTWILNTNFSIKPNVPVHGFKGSRGSGFHPRLPFAFTMRIYEKSARPGHA